jgi:hypothetical protein
VTVSLANVERSERVYRWHLGQPPALLAASVQTLVDRTGRKLTPDEEARFGLNRVQTQP